MASLLASQTETQEFLYESADVMDARHSPTDGNLPYDNPFESRCWPRRSATGFDILFGWGVILFGFVIAGVALHLLNRIPKPDTSGAIVLGVLAGLSVLGGLVALTYRQFIPHLDVVTSAEGMELVSDKSTQKFGWSDIHKIVTMEFHPHVNAETVLLVTIETRNGREIKIDTGFEGDPGNVIHTLLTHCDYIVRNPEGYSSHTS